MKYSRVANLHALFPAFKKYFCAQLSLFYLHEMLYCMLNIILTSVGHDNLYELMPIVIFLKFKAHAHISNWNMYFLPEIIKCYAT